MYLPCLPSSELSQSKILNIGSLLWGVDYLSNQTTPESASSPDMNHGTKKVTSGVKSTLALVAHGPPLRDLPFLHFSFCCHHGKQMRQLWFCHQSKNIQKSCCCSPNMLAQPQRDRSSNRQPCAGANSRTSIPVALSQRKLCVTQL